MGQGSAWPQTHGGRGRSSSTHPEGEIIPFAGYKDHADCKSKNSDKRDPDAYCASIARAIEGKDAAYQEAFAKALEGEDTDWLDTRDWHNDRTHSAFINDSLVDFQGDRVTMEA